LPHGRGYPSSRFLRAPECFLAHLRRPRRRLFAHIAGQLVPNEHGESPSTVGFRLQRKATPLNLSGRLALTTLGDLLGTLHRSKARGALELVEDTGPTAGRTHRLHFDCGSLRFIESPLGAERLGELLVGKGLVSRARHLDLLASLEDFPGTSTGQRLIELNWVLPAAIGETAREQASRRLDALYQLTDARVAFRIATPMPSGLVAAMPLAVSEFLHGRPRTRDRRRVTNAAPPASKNAASGLRLVDPQRRRALLVLGLEPHADTLAVKRAYRRMVARLHPDRHLIAPEHQRELARKRFSQVTEAYQLLTA
jgi:DnaJ-domain-containing protein 1